MKIENIFETASKISYQKTIVIVSIEWWIQFVSEKKKNNKLVISKKNLNDYF